MTNIKEWDFNALWPSAKAVLLACNVPPQALNDLTAHKIEELPHNARSKPQVLPALRVFAHINGYQQPSVPVHLAYTEYANRPTFWLLFPCEVYREEKLKKHHLLCINIVDSAKQGGPDTGIVITCDNDRQLSLELPFVLNEDSPPIHKWLAAEYFTAQMRRILHQCLFNFQLPPDLAAAKKVKLDARAAELQHLEDLKARRTG